MTWCRWFGTVRDQVANNRYLIVLHAAERLEQRGIMEWQTVQGERIKRTRLIQTPVYVVAVEVEMIVPDEDPSEPCYEPGTVEFLRQVREHADANDIEWLGRHGRVYRVLETA